MLMNHSSGIAEIGQQQVDLHCADPDRFVNPTSSCRLALHCPRAPFAPGDGFLYSSTNTIILGRILEKVTNQSYASLMSVVLLIIWHILLRFIWHTDSCGRTFRLPASVA
jgi:D-alanyl-D-alanine carboxypeptidase